MHLKEVSCNDRREMKNHSRFGAEFCGALCVCLAKGDCVPKIKGRLGGRSRETAYVAESHSLGGYYKLSLWVHRLE